MINGFESGGNVSLASLWMSAITGGAFLIGGVLVKTGVRTVAGIGRVKVLFEGYRRLGIRKVFLNRSGRLSEAAKRIVWLLGDVVRGVAIEAHLAATEYTQSSGWWHIGMEQGGSFKTLDFLSDYEAVSLKTAKDITSGRVSYLKSYVDKLADFDVLPLAERSRVLDLRIPPGAATDGLDSLNTYARSRGVDVRVATFP